MNAQQVESRVDFGFIRQDEILKTVLPVSSATFWRMVAAEQFPQPVKLGKRITAWRILDVATWSASQGVEPKQTTVKKAVKSDVLVIPTRRGHKAACAIDCSGHDASTALTGDSNCSHIEVGQSKLSI